jgi:uncharacterized zinc-type alcohol dehydrogenase-like protein
MSHLVAPSVLSANFANLQADIEMINIDQINEAYERTLKGDVHYRFVIDMKSLK